MLTTSRRPIGACSIEAPRRASPWRASVGTSKSRQLQTPSATSSAIQNPHFNVKVW